MGLNFPQLEGKRNYAKEIEERDCERGLVPRALRPFFRRLWPGEQQGFQPLIMFVVLLSVITMWVADSRREEESASKTSNRRERSERHESRRHVPIWALR